MYYDETRENVVVLAAARGHRSKADMAATPGPYTRFGEVTCTSNVDGQRVVVESTTTSVVCWRQKRTLTVMAIAIGRTPPQLQGVGTEGRPSLLMSRAAQAVSRTWDAN